MTVNCMQHVKNTPHTHTHTLYLSQPMTISPLVSKPERTKSTTSTMHSKIIHSHYNAQQSVAPAGPGWCLRWSWGGCGQGCPLCLYQQLQHYSLINVKLAGSVWSCCLYQQLQHYSLINVKLAWVWLKSSVCLYRQLQHYSLINVKLAKVVCMSESTTSTLLSY